MYSFSDTNVSCWGPQAEAAVREAERAALAAELASRPPPPQPSPKDLRAATSHAAHLAASQVHQNQYHYQYQYQCITCCPDGLVAYV